MTLYKLAGEVLRCLALKARHGNRGCHDSDFADLAYLRT